MIHVVPFKAEVLSQTDEQEVHRLKTELDEAHRGQMDYRLFIMSITMLSVDVYDLIERSLSETQILGIVTNN